ncbi:hypothetical protein DGG96_18015 [Legionella qingyii]|nr:hypothetical protein DGG96_18015 [Legionella qingyii]RUR22380.1 hypothetical protein ELY16_14750 [Legionella qingyii]
MDPQPKEKDKAEIIEFLTKTFHQGGLMNPVSAALATSMERKALPGEDGAREGRIAWGTISDMQLVVNIIPTKEGFKVKEHVGVKKIMISENSWDEYDIAYTTYSYGNEIVKDAASPYIFRDDGTDIIEAQGEISVDLSNAKKPKISIESNAISYGHHRLKEELHSHSVLQWIIDFVQNAFGYNKVEVLEPVSINENPSQSPETPSPESPSQPTF